MTALVGRVWLLDCGWRWTLHYFRTSDCKSQVCLFLSGAAQGLKMSSLGKKWHELGCDILAFCGIPSRSGTLGTKQRSQLFGPARNDMVCIVAGTQVQQRRFLASLDKELQPEHCRVKHALPMAWWFFMFFQRPARDVRGYNDGIETDANEAQIAMCTLRSFPYLLQDPLIDKNNTDNKK